MLTNFGIWRVRMDGSSCFTSCNTRKYTFQKCAEEQRRKCRSGEFTYRPELQSIFGLPMCGIRCRLLHGSRKIHSYLDRCADCKFEEQCAEFSIQTSQSEPPTNYKIDEEAEYECFASGAFTITEGGIDVGNTTVNCNVTWVLSWFPHVNITLKFIPRPVWVENPIT